MKKVLYSWGLILQRLSADDTISQRVNVTRRREIRCIECFISNLKSCCFEQLSQSLILIINFKTY